MREVRLRNFRGSQREGQSLDRTPGAQNICFELSPVQNNVSMPASFKTMKSAPVFIGHHTSPRSVLTVRAASSLINLTERLTKVSSLQKYSDKPEQMSVFINATSTLLFHHRAHRCRDLSAASNLEGALLQTVCLWRSTAKRYTK